MRATRTWMIAAVTVGMIAVAFGGPAGRGPVGRPVQATAGSGLVASPMSVAVTPVPALAAAPGGRTAYTTGTVQLRKDPGGAVVGTVTPGTTMSVTETSGTDAHVTVAGYSSAGSSMVVAAVGVRIVLVTLTAPDQADRNLGAQTKDSYGTVWTEVTVSGWVPSNALTADVQTVWAHGRQLYEAHCSSCHSLYAPDQYTANQWPGTLQGMASQGGLSGDDLTLVLKYLQTHAKQQ